MTGTVQDRSGLRLIYADHSCLVVPLVGLCQEHVVWNPGQKDKHDGMKADISKTKEELNEQVALASNLLAERRWSQAGEVITALQVSRDT